MATANTAELWETNDEDNVATTAREALARVLREEGRARTVTKIEREQHREFLDLLVGLLRKPDIADDGQGPRLVLAADGTVIEISGGLISRDRILEHTDFGQRASKVEERLELFEQHGPIKTGLVTEDRALDEWVAHARDRRDRFGDRKFTMPPHAACAVLAGRDLRAAMLLYQLRFWENLMTHRRGGHRWAVKLKREWCDETALSLRQFDAARDRLVERGLAKCEVHKSRFYEGSTATFMRPHWFVGWGDAITAEDT